MQRAPDRESTGFFEDLVKKYDSIWQTFILPERMTYNKESLGPQTRRLDEKTVYRREDMQCLNVRGELIEASLFKLDPSPQKTSLSSDTCLIYLHSHGGNRLEGLSLLRFAGGLGVNFCCFDFAGSGQSEGTYTTLGLRESEDCRVVVDHLMRNYGLKRFILWGRSMGAVAALLYAAGNMPHIKFMVLDSPFSDVEQMVRDAGNSYISLGEYLAVFLFSMVKEDISKHIGHDLGTFKPIQFCQNCTVPALFMVGKDDRLVLPSRVEEMFTAYRGSPKDLMLVEGSHSSGRSQAEIEKAFTYIERLFNTGMDYSVSMAEGNVYGVLKQSSTVANKLNEIGNQIMARHPLDRVKLTKEKIGNADKENRVPRNEYKLGKADDRVPQERRPNEIRAKGTGQIGKVYAPFIVGPSKVVRESNAWGQELLQANTIHTNKVNEHLGYQNNFNAGYNDHKTPRSSFSQKQADFKENHAGINVIPFGQQQSSPDSQKALLSDFKPQNYSRQSPNCVRRVVVQTDRSSSRPRGFGGIIREHQNASPYRLYEAREYSDKPFEPLLTYRHPAHGNSMADFASPLHDKDRLARHRSPLTESMASSRINNSTFRPDSATKGDSYSKLADQKNQSPYVDQIQLREALKRRLNSKQNSEKDTKGEKYLNTSPVVGKFDLKTTSFNEPANIQSFRLPPSHPGFRDPFIDTRPKRDLRIFDDEDLHTLKPTVSYHNLSQADQSFPENGRRRSGMFSVNQGH